MGTVYGGLVVTRTFKVAEIHCDGCENTIRTALSRVPGVIGVVASADAGDVKVSFDDTQLGEDDVRARLSDIGFEPVS